MTGLWYGMRRGWGVIHRYGKIRKGEKKCSEFLTRQFAVGRSDRGPDVDIWEYWFVFLLFPALNVIDCIRVCKIKGNPNAVERERARGVLKKVIIG